MFNKELSNLTNWRFTKVEAGGKKPYPSGWQRMPLTLNDIPQTDNIGLLSGPYSGIMAIDFDGPWAFQWWEQNIKIAIPNTVAWSSGKEGRCQFAFSVPELVWPLLRTRKFGNGLPKPFLEGIEFRWDGAQSVLPPSIHPDTKSEYFWVNAPSTVAVAELPIEVIENLLLVHERSAKQAFTERTHTNIDTIKPADFEQLEAVLKQLKGFMPTLDYDNWLKVTFATANEIGDDAAAMLLSSIWPEEHEGEYRSHLRGRDVSRSPTMGTLVYLVKEMQGTNVPLHRKIVNNNKF